MVKAKSAYATRLSSLGSSGSHWSTINALTSRVPSHTSLSCDEAERLNDVFARVFQKEDLDPNSLYGVNESFVPCIVTPEDVRLAISETKSNASGPDAISGVIYRKFSSILSVPLAGIFNMCFAACDFPISWRRANIIAKEKKGTDQHRPISLLPFPSKVLEKLTLWKLLIPSLQRPFNPQQFAYIPGGCGGCTSALTYIRLHTLQHISNTSGYTRILSLDFSKAFDTISHRLILQILADRFGCPAHLIRFVASYLTNRCQRVVSGPHITQWRPASSGVPQGSVLGPLLFAMYVDDACPVNTNTSFVIYADDFNVLHNVSSTQHDKLQEEVDELVKWSRGRKLVLNPSKTQLLTVSRSKAQCAPIVISGTTIYEAANARILGVYFSCDTKWDLQFSTLYARCCRCLSMVKKLWQAGGASRLVWLAYLGLVFSQIAWCWPVLCDVPKSHKQKLLRLELTVARWAGTRPPKALSERLDDVCVRLIKRIASNKNAHPLAEFFQVRDFLPKVRNPRILLPPPSRHSFLQNSFVKYSAWT